MLKMTIFEMQYHILDKVYSRWQVYHNRKKFIILLLQEKSL